MTGGDPRRTTLLAVAALLSVTAMWGSTFFLTKDLLERVPTTDYLAVRFTIAAALMLTIAPRAIARLSREARRHALVLGVLYGLAQIVQTAGLAHTAASVSGFITGLYVVFTPVLAAVLLDARTTPWTWSAVALATVGLGVLSLEGLAVGFGEALTLVSAVLYALHIVGLGAWSRPDDALGMSILQLVVIAAVCGVATAPDGVVLPPTPQDWLSVVYMAAFAGALLAVTLTYLVGATGGRLDPVTSLVLAGVAVASFFTAVQTFVQQRDSETIRQVYFFVLGQLRTAGWAEVGLVAPYTGVCLLVILALRRRMDALGVGDEEAGSLGLDVRRVRLVAVLAASLGTAAAVAVSGLIGFVGIIVPHTIRLLFGASYRVILPLTVLFGGAFLVAADLVARLALEPAEIPIGVVTAFLGAPFFVLVLRTARRSR